MTRTKTISFAELRRLLENLGYRHEHVDKGEIFHQTENRELYYRRYRDRDTVTALDLSSTRRFLDAWGQLDAADFDAFLDSTTKPA